MTMLLEILVDTRIVYYQQFHLSDLEKMLHSYIHPHLLLWLADAAMCYQRALNYLD